MINYIDTATMYFTFHIPPYKAVNTHLHKPWRFRNKAREPSLHHWFLKDGAVFMAYYPDLFGHARLFVTFSVPRLLKGSNTFHVTDLDEGACYARLERSLNKFPWQQFRQAMPSSFHEWQASRIDLFLMHRIPVGEREEYMGAYELLMLSRYRPKRYKNTYYLNSGKRPDKKSNKVFRVYPKAQEIHDRLTGDDYPLAVHKRHEAYLQMDEEMRDYIRFEWMLRRSILKYECKKLNVQPDMHEVLQQQFQESMLSKLIAAIGLDRLILSRNEFKKKIKPLFKTGKTYQNALQLARQIRNRQSVTLTVSQAALVKKTLKQNGIHFITTAYMSLNPVLLKP